MFFSFRAAYNQMKLTIEGGLHFFFILSKGLDSTQSFLDYILSTNSVSILFLLFSIMCTLRHRRDYDEQKAVVVM